MSRAGAVLDETWHAAIIARVSKDTSGRERSITEQNRLNERACGDEGWIYGPLDVYAAEGSASEFRRKEVRDEWERLLRAVAEGRYQVIVLWHTNRASRDVGDWVPFLKLCERKGVCIYQSRDSKLFDPDVAGDWKTLHDEGTANAYFSRALSEDIKRAHAGNRQEGRPHGIVPYGYQRKYDPVTRDLLHQGTIKDEAEVVRWIIRRAARGDALSRITFDLNVGHPDLNGGQPVPPPTRPGNRVNRQNAWSVSTVKGIACNPAYIAMVPTGPSVMAYDRKKNPKGSKTRRKDIGSMARTTWWEPVIDDDTWWACYRNLNDPKRQRFDKGYVVPGAARHLLTYIVTCGECGGHMQIVQKTSAANGPVSYIGCGVRHDVAIREDAADAEVTSRVLERLVLLARQGFKGKESERVVQYRERIREHKALKDEHFSSLRQHRLTHAQFNLLVADEDEAIATAQAQIDALLVPAQLHPFTSCSKAADIPAAVRDVWDSLGIEGKRLVIRTLAKRIVILKAEHPGRGQAPASERIPPIDWHPAAYVYGTDAAAGDDRAEVL